jgi:hypothetical protein
MGCSSLAPNAVRSETETASDLVRPAGFEPATRCLEGTVEASRCVAWCRPMSHLTAQMRDGRGLASPGVCGRWLPVWLPDLCDSAFVRMSENASAAPHACGGARWGECRLRPAGRRRQIWCARSARARPATTALWTHRELNRLIGRQEPWSSHDERGVSASRVAAGRAPPRPFHGPPGRLRRLSH